MKAEALAAWMARKHERVCEPARSCTCHTDHIEARRLAKHIHAKFEHPGMPDACQSPHDVLCKAVQP